jgi:hypothetical protein
MLDWRACLFWVLASVALAPAGRADDTRHAATPAKSPTKSATVPEADDDLLDFLGSVDSDDQEWNDYLSHTDIVKVANKPAAKSPPPAAEVKK